ncbi:MAG: response regulator [Endomicrobiales bacterium]|nr:response regulator [Endomicrobiales bacterium]
MAKKILIADDEQEIIDLLEIALKSANYDVVSVTHGAQIPELIQKEKPDLLILDVLLPGIDGYSLQLQFSQQEQTRNIPVIIITALPAAKTLFEKFQQVKLFLSKPFDTSELLVKVEEILGE